MSRKWSLALALAVLTALLCMPASSPLLAQQTGSSGWYHRPQGHGSYSSGRSYQSNRQRMGRVHIPGAARTYYNSQQAGSQAARAPGAYSAYRQEIAARRYFYY